MISKPSLTLLYIVFLCGVSRPQLAGPSSGICPGDDVTFTCVVSTTITIWTVNSGGMKTDCTYNQNMPAIRTCGPGGRFTSSVTDMNGDPNNSSLSVDSVTSDLSGTSVTCIDGNAVMIGSGDICVTDVLESSEFQSATVSGFGDMCQLSLEWSEAVVNCSGDVPYTVTATPCLSGSGDCEVIGGSPVETFSTTESQITLSVNGSVGLEYDFTVSTCANTSDVYRVNLTAGSSSGVESSFNYIYNIIVTLDVDAVNVTWGRYFVLGEEAAYRVVIDEQVIDIVTSRYCSGDMCGYIHYSDSLNSSSSVAVDVVGCGTQGISLKNETSFCDPDDLLFPGVDWTAMPEFTDDGQGFYSFPGGNVTYDGVSLGSNATYRASVDFLVNGVRFLERRCENNAWKPPEVIISDAECVLRELLPCDIPVNVSETETALCCTGEDGTTELCVEYSGISIGSDATYNTSEQLCFRRRILRFCTPDQTWDGDIPVTEEVDGSAPFGPANTALVVLGLILFTIGLLILAAFVAVLLFKINGKIKCWHWILFAVAIAGTVVGAVLWFSLLGYSVDNVFIEDDGYMRAEDMICEVPSGRVNVRTGLAIGCFVLGLLAPVLWVTFLIIIKLCRNTDFPDGGNLEDQEMKEIVETEEAYDILKRGPSSNTQVPPDSDSDRGYGKLSQRGAEEPAHYGKLDHAGKKTATVAPAVGDAEYGKLDRTQMQPEEPGHYGKLDHSGKKTNTLPVADPGSSEYGKLDRSQMEDPLHYGKLDHPGKRGATLPGGVAPTDTEGYGKLDNTQMQAGGSSARGGDMYDTVSHEPRHKVPSSKSKRQHSSSGH